MCLELLHLPLMPIIHPLSITALVNAMLPPAHMLVTKKTSINEIKLGKHPKLMQLLVLSTRKLFLLLSLGNKVFFFLVVSLYIPNQMPINILTIV